MWVNGEPNLPLAKRIWKAAENPRLALTWALCQVRPAHYCARLLASAHASGIKKPSFILSFDCDTDRDGPTLEQLHPRLRSMGLHPLYAAPGEILLDSASTYRDIAADGAEFMNHGYRRHATVEPATGQVLSTYFYDPEKPQDWMNDITLGHQAVTELTGRRPSGFRTPHFGSFESPAALNKLWQLLAKLGYIYSSSTRPLFAAMHGPVFHNHGVAEIPVSGCLDQPNQILDSWGLVNNAPLGDLRLINQIRKYLDLMRSGKPILLNLYFDPADITENDELISLLSEFAPYEVDGGFKALAPMSGGQ